MVREVPRESAAGPPRSDVELTVHRFSIFDPARVVHGITSRCEALPLAGNMSYMVGDSEESVRQNRRTWASAIGYDSSRLVLGRQVHETTVAVVDEQHAGRGADSVETSIRRVDALITRTSKLPIGIMAADCVPMMVYDPVTHSAGAIHAGWRGTVEGIGPAAVEAMRANFGSSPRDLLVGLGPAICASCYQVGEEVIDRWRQSGFDEFGEAMHEGEDGLYFDLRAANRIQLRWAGVPASNIETSPICTRCSGGRMFSRRGLGPRTGLFTSVIMLRDVDSQTAERTR